MNITLPRAVVEQALEALEAMNPYPASKEDQRNKAITALRTALEQPEQEPVTYQDTAEKCRLETVPAKGTLLHTAAPQRTPAQAVE